MHSSTARSNMRILYEDNNILVRLNWSGEVFVRNKRAPNTEIRISDEIQSLVVTAMGSDMTPTAVNGLSAFRVRGR